jgi:hypothetical protein
MTIILSFLLYPHHMGKIIHRINRFALLIQIISFNFAGNILIIHKISTF